MSAGAGGSAVQAVAQQLARTWRVASVAVFAAVRAARAQHHIFKSHDVGHTVVPHATLACRMVGAARASAQRRRVLAYPTNNKTVRHSDTYPCARIDVPQGIPVEVTLVSKLGLGIGNQLYMDVTRRQLIHDTYEDEFGEESAQLGATHIHLNDPDVPDDVTALYTFSVSSKGHPFHRHEGHRCFTAVSGSSGSRLGFSYATPSEVAEDPRAFIDKLAFVDVPPDALFTVRFNGSVYHQFTSLNPPDPAFFAISVHTDETGGDLAPDVLQSVKSGVSSIGMLTELAPPTVHDLLLDINNLRGVPLTVLTFDEL